MQAPADSFRSDLFAGKIILVSGGSSGVGLALARGYAALGGTVLVTGTSEAKLEANREDAANQGITFLRLDVRDDAAIAERVAQLPRLDVLVNAAGILSVDAPFDEATYLDVIDVNLHGALRLALAGEPLLARSGGNILNIVSMICFTGSPAMVAYTASKSALKGLTHTLAHRFGRDGIRVNAIAPGFHKTAMSAPVWSDPIVSDRVVRRTALGRWGEVDDIVGPALFLSSPAAAYVTGETFVVDGGWLSGSGLD
ncbi:SDR family NAD(P)-dependent oxidoreductase [Sphingomonas sp. ABOLE]|uniref:SDR family NAD(P)-dependent oxidoreductase n=1 Tax=Sphingomonas sp. ABOLE TaxID=1985878 RepID=UPI000F7EB1B3|nr:SDR family oxidoreductase [Sphingomonas sp. ABOLE]RSV40126.1 SDR family NAD(P)-dependent oxidoreductase [Sphingomonas sp. ABOLE]